MMSLSLSQAALIGSGLRQVEVLELAAVARRAAAAGGAKLREHYGRLERIREKGRSGDLVTEADEAAEAAVLAVLRVNGLAAYTTGGITNVITDADIRSQPLPVVTADDAAIADDEWVTRTVAVRYLDAAQLVPVLRPLLPQAGQLSAVPGSNALLLVDRYANTRRLIATLREMDKPPAR